MFRSVGLIAVLAAMVMAFSLPADARPGGRGGGGFRGGAVHVGGFRGPARVGGFYRGPRRAGIVYGGPRRVGFVGVRRGFYGGRVYRGGFYRPGWRRVYRRPFYRGYGYRPFVGVGYGSCWRWRPTPWGWRRVWVCGPRYRVFPRVIVVPPLYRYW